MEPELFIDVEIEYGNDYWMIKTEGKELWVSHEYPDFGMNQLAEFLRELHLVVTVKEIS